MPGSTRPADRPRRGWYGVLALLVGPALVLAGSSVAGADPAAPAEHVPGRVTGPGGSPAAGVVVNAYRLVDSEWQAAANDVTSETGSYDLTRLAAGTYRIGFRDPTGALATEYFDDQASLDVATDVTLGGGGLVVDGAPVDGVDARLAPAGRITGTVTGTTGPLAGIAVVAYQRVGTAWRPATYVWTARDGTYDLRGLRADRYRLQLQDSSGSSVGEFYDDVPTVDLATDLPVAAGAVLSGIDAQLAPVAATSPAPAPAPTPAPGPSPACSGARASVSALTRTVATARATATAAAAKVRKARKAGKPAAEVRAARKKATRAKAAVSSAEAALLVAQAAVAASC